MFPGSPLMTGMDMMQSGNNPFTGMGEKMAGAAKTKLAAQKSTFMGAQPTAFGGMLKFQPKQQAQTFMGGDQTTSDIWK